MSKQLTCYLFLAQLYEHHAPNARIRDVHIVARTGNERATTVHCLPVVELDCHTVHEVTYPLVHEVAQLINRDCGYETLY